MKFLLLLIPFLLAPSPQVVAAVEEPVYGCDLDKGYCVVKLEEFQELTEKNKRRCTELDT